MKRLLVLILLIFILFSCKKGRELKSLEEEIVGIWEKEISIGAFSPIHYPPGNGQTIVFSGSGTFERKNYDTIIFKGTYLLKHKEDCHPNTSNTILITDEYPSSPGIYISIESGKLILSTPNCFLDGGSDYYRRIQ